MHNNTHPGHPSVRNQDCSIWGVGVMSPQHMHQAPYYQIQGGLKHTFAIIKYTYI